MPRQQSPRSTGTCISLTAVTSSFQWFVNFLAQFCASFFQSICTGLIISSKNIFYLFSFIFSMVHTVIHAYMQQQYGESVSYIHPKSIAAQYMFLTVENACSNFDIHLIGSYEDLTKNKWSQWLIANKYLTTATFLTQHTNGTRFHYIFSMSQTSGYRALLQLSRQMLRRS